jgi:hypothetical protein
MKGQTMKWTHEFATPLQKWSVLAAAAVCVIAGCATPGDLTDYSYLQARRDGLAMSVKENARLVEGLAVKTERAYGSAQYLSFDAECTWPGNVRLQARVAMAPHRLKTVGFIDSTRVVVCTLQNGLFEEYKAAFNGVPTMYQLKVVGDACGPDDLDLLEGIEEYGCPMGGYYHTWLGQGASKPDFFVERTRAGDYLGTTVLDGQRCDLVLCQPTARYGGIELFYFRPDGLAVRWDTFRVDEAAAAPKHARSRIYQRLSLNPLPPDTWDFESLVLKDVEATTTAYQGIEECVRKQEWGAALRVMDTLRDKLPQDIGLLKKRFHVLAVGLKDHKAADSWAEQLFTQVNRAPGFLNDFAWALLTDEKYGGQYAEMALRWSERANELTDYGSWPILDTLARASFETGNVERAIRLQGKAIKLSGGNMPELNATLARYREGGAGDDQTPSD